jgi:hypothetical protein
MFAEDLSGGIIPPSGVSWSGKGFRGFVKGMEDQGEAALGVLRTIAGHDSGLEEEVVARAIYEIGRHLTQSGRACFEIWRDEGRIGLSTFPPIRFVRVAGILVQFIPAQDRDLFERHFVFLPARRTWIVTMPRALGGATGYGRVLKRLGRLPLGGRPDMIVRLEKGEAGAPGEIVAYGERADLLAAAATRQWGWNGRDLSDRRFTGFWIFHRMIRFCLAQAIVREHIVQELNRLLPRLGIDAQVIVEGLPASDDIRRILTEVSAGRMSLGDAWTASRV